MFFFSFLLYSILERDKGEITTKQKPGRPLLLIYASNLFAFEGDVVWAQSKMGKDICIYILRRKFFNTHFIIFHH